VGKQAAKKAVADRPANTLSWDERNPARYDCVPVDLSRWVDLKAPKKKGADKTNSKG
jgi:hypothetical protein